MISFNSLIDSCLGFAFLLLAMIGLDVSWQTKSGLRSVKK